MKKWQGDDIYSGDLKTDHSKSGLFEAQISNGPVTKGRARALFPTI